MNKTLVKIMIYAFCVALLVVDFIILKRAYLAGENIMKYIIIAIVCGISYTIKSLIKNR